MKQAPANDLKASDISLARIEPGLYQDKATRRYWISRDGDRARTTSWYVTLSDPREAISARWGALLDAEGRDLRICTADTLDTARAFVAQHRSTEDARVARIERAAALKAENAAAKAAGRKRRLVIPETLRPRELVPLYGMDNLYTFAAQLEETRDEVGRRVWHVRLEGNAVPQSVRGRYVGSVVEHGVRSYGMLYRSAAVDADDASGVEWQWRDVLHYKEEGRYWGSRTYREACAARAEHMISRVLARGLAEQSDLLHEAMEVGHEDDEAKCARRLAEARGLAANED